MDKALIFVMAVFSLLMGAQSYIWLNSEALIPESHATGGGEVVKQVLPDLEQAIEKLEAGDIETGLSMLKDAYLNLKDTSFEE